MTNKSNEDEIWEIIGFIKISSTRYKTLQTLKTDFLMPSEIAKVTDLTPTQVSLALHDLKEKNLVKCMNENAKKGRIYKSTSLGLESLKMIEKSVKK